MPWKLLGDAIASKRLNGPSRHTYNINPDVFVISTEKTYVQDQPGCLGRRRSEWDSGCSKVGT